jgi:hypothetical protein
MSNATTTFRLQSYGTSSAFDPNIIDFSRDTINGGGNNGNKQFITNEIFNIETNIGFLITSNNSYYFAIKPQHNSFTVSQLLLPCQMLPTLNKTFGISIGFFEYEPTSCGNPDPEIYGKLNSIVPPFSVEGSISDYNCASILTIQFPDIVLPETKFTTYVGIKLYSTDNIYLPQIRVERFSSSVSISLRNVLGFASNGSNTSQLKSESLVYRAVDPTLISSFGVLPVIWIN